MCESVAACVLISLGGKPYFQERKISRLIRLCMVMATLVSGLPTSDYKLNEARDSSTCGGRGTHSLVCWEPAVLESGGGRGGGRV